MAEYHVDTQPWRRFPKVLVMVKEDGHHTERRRYAPERLCHDFGGQEGTNGEGYDFACTACGFCCDLPEPNYCPNCGARVMDR